MNSRCQIVNALALCALLLSGCGSSDSPDAETSVVGLDEARSFSDFTLYYLGDSYEALPLTFAGLGPGSGKNRAWDFIYGDCTPAGGDGGCAPPIDVQNWSICTRFPALYPGPTPKTSTLHGAEVVRAGGGLDVYTGRTTVVVFGGDSSAAVPSLTRVSDDVTPQTLPPPVPGALEGKLACQAKRLRRFSR